MELDESTQRKIIQYMVHARKALETGRLVMTHEDNIAAVNRAYYAIFYAANALLATQGLERSKHSGVIAVFRQHFVKTGIVAPEFSSYYGEALDDRHAGDYDLVEFGYEVAERDLSQAERFVEQIEQVLRSMGVVP